MTPLHRLGYPEASSNLEYQLFIKLTKGTRLLGNTSASGSFFMS